MEILYEDLSVIVCVKPVGVLSQEGGGENIVDLLKADRAASEYIGVVHRLDRMTGGVMVYAKTPSSAAALSKQISDRQFFKTYLAVVRGEPEKEGRMEDLLFRDMHKNKSYVVNRPRRGTKKAVLTYKTLQTCGENSLVEIYPETGRTHQIRVQFSHRKMPLLGDGKYGGGDNKCSLALWCKKLEFAHPKSGESLSFCAEPPKVYPWDMFSSE